MGDPIMTWQRGCCFSWGRKKRALQGGGLWAEAREACCKASRGTIPWAEGVDGAEGGNPTMNLKSRKQLVDLEHVSLRRRLEGEM